MIVGRLMCLLLDGRRDLFGLYKLIGGEELKRS
jgi:hypothetical protein